MKETNLIHQLIGSHIFCRTRFPFVLGQVLGKIEHTMQNHILAIINYSGRENVSRNTTIIHL